MKLICFSYAGGHAVSYLQLRKRLSPVGLRVIPFELPGRGMRSKERLLTSMDLIIEDHMQQLRPHLTEPFAFFGHSMGAMIAHLLTLRLIEERLPTPVHLFLSGKPAPAIRDGSEPKYLLPDEEFRQYLRSLGGSPKEVLDDETSMKYFITLLRADFQAAETCDERPGRTHDVPITAFAGEEDKIDLQKVKGWQRSTSQPFSFYSFTGEHFFILSHWDEIADIIALHLSDLLVDSASRGDA